MHQQDRKPHKPLSPAEKAIEDRLLNERPENPSGQPAGEPATARPLEDIFEAGKALRQANRDHARRIWGSDKP